MANVILIILAPLKERGHLLYTLLKFSHLKQCKRNYLKWVLCACKALTQQTNLPLRSAVKVLWLLSVRRLSLLHHTAIRSCHGHYQVVSPDSWPALQSLQLAVPAKSGKDFTI